MSSEEEGPVAWLRAQVEARLALAREASPHTDGHWWRRMTDAGHFDDGTLEPVGALWAGEPELDVDGDVFGGEYVVVYDEGAPSDAQFDHIAANDPQDTIARCEAELAILDLYERTLAIVRAPVDFGALAAEKPVIRELRAQDYLDAERELCVLWEVVSLLSGGYKHSPGFPAAFAAN
jgi:hypothetical protein